MDIHSHNKLKARCYNDTEDCKITGCDDDKDLVPEILQQFEPDDRRCILEFDYVFQIRNSELKVKRYG